MNISHLDHLVLTVADLEATIDFYTRVLGMQAVTFGEGRKALCTQPEKEDGGCAPIAGAYQNWREGEPNSWQGHNEDSAARHLRIAFFSLDWALCFSQR